MNQTLQIGRLLRSSITGCVVGCKVTEIDAPPLGSLLRIPLNPEASFNIYGFISDIHVDDDGLVRQLVSSSEISNEVILDNRNNRNVPLEISVVFCGYDSHGKVSHLLPPRPPLTLDEIFLCSESELFTFTSPLRFGYFRHLLRAKDIPVGEILASHLQQTALVHRKLGKPEWIQAACQELIASLRDDYPVLIDVLRALADAEIMTGETITFQPGGVR